MRSFPFAIQPLIIVTTTVKVLVVAPIDYAKCSSCTTFTSQQLRDLLSRGPEARGAGTAASGSAGE